MSEGYTETADRLWDSFRDAIKPRNWIWKIISFVVLIILTAVPYLVLNLNKFALEVQSQTAISNQDFIIGLLRALSTTIYQGWFVGLSTFWQTLLDVLAGNYLWGSIVVSIIVFVLAAFSLYQPFQVLADIFDSKEGKAYRTGVVFAFTILITFLLTPVAHNIMDGETITSSLQMPDTVSDMVDEVVGTNQTEAELDPLKEKGPQVGIAVLDFGDENNETN